MRQSNAFQGGEMEPVKKGQRGSAVEDVQRRLLLLGYDLGSTGVDGAYLDYTIKAIEQFQSKNNITANGIVDDKTWRLLVNATFSMGDRNLFLRFPYFHGKDVLMLQQAITVLGFTCGACDGIFGAFTESAIREFQANAGDPKTVAKKWKISKKSELQNIAYFNYANLRYYMGSDYFFFV